MLYGHYHSPTRELTPSEEKFLDTFLKGLYQVNPSLHNNLFQNEKKKQVYLLGF